MIFHSVILNIIIVLIETLLCTEYDILRLGEILGCKFIKFLKTNIPHYLYKQERKSLSGRRGGGDHPSSF